MIDEVPTVWPLTPELRARLDRALWRVRHACRNWADCGPREANRSRRELAKFLVEELMQCIADVLDVPHEPPPKDDYDPAIAERIRHVYAVSSRNGMRRDHA